MADADGAVSVSVKFDEDSRIRVLDPEHYKHSEELGEECKAFTSKIQDFSASVHSIVGVLDTHAKRIEREKLLAIGMRNQVDGEQEYRVRQKAALKALLKEKMAELDRYGLQYQSLQRVESEQIVLMEKLSHSEALLAGEGEDTAPHK